MATQKKNTKSSGSKSSSSGKKTSGKGTAGKSSGSASRASGKSSGRNAGRSSGRKNSRKSGNDNRLTNIFLALLLIAVLVLAVMYFNNKTPEEGTENKPAPTAQASGGDKNTGNQGSTANEPNSGENNKPTATLAAGKEPEDAVPTESGGEDNQDGQKETAPTPTEAPAPTEEIPDEIEAALSIEEAEAILSAAISEEGYSFLLSDDHLRTDGKTYYCYVILYQQQEEDYVVLVDQQTGELFYYDSTGSKSKFQGVTGYPGPGASEEMTLEKAKALLSDLEPAELMLPAPFSECSLTLDDWKTVVNGEECYCMDVFYKGSLAGSIYFTETAERVYYLNEFGEFVKVRGM